MLIYNIIKHIIHLVMISLFINMIIEMEEEER